MKSQIQLFDEKKVRTVWDEENEEWYFSIVDVVEVLTDTDRPRKYWNDLKKKLKLEGSELSEKIGQLKMKAPDGKMRLTDIANTDQLFRLIQSIPSPKAEPFKLWIAQVAKERLDQMQDPELSIEQVLVKPATLTTNSEGSTIGKFGIIPAKEVVTPVPVPAA